MIEKLLDQTLPYGEPEYSRSGEEIIELRKRLNGQLDQEGQALLEQLADTYIRQCNAALRGAFEDGFCIAIKLILEALS